jgi:hypothetical protein
VDPRRKPRFHRDRDAEAGLRGRFPCGARRKPDAGRSRREGGFQGRKPAGSRARWSTGRWELAAARGEGRKVRTSLRRHKPKADAGGSGKGTGVLETGRRARRSSRRKPVATKGQEACQRAASERSRDGESQCGGERQARRLAGRNGRRRWARARRRMPEPEGGRRVERERWAQAWSEPQPESEARRSVREDGLRARPKSQGKGEGRKARAEGCKPEPRCNGSRRIDRR